MAVVKVHSSRQLLVLRCLGSYIPHTAVQSIQEMWHSHQRFRQLWQPRLSEGVQERERHAHCSSCQKKYRVSDSYPVPPRWKLLNVANNCMNSKLTFHAVIWQNFCLLINVLSYVSWLCLHCVFISRSQLLILCWNTGTSRWIYTISPCTCCLLTYRRITVGEKIEEGG